ncbi:MAG TPA: TetR family transcriptional regulator [Caulobacteraceae bacterium]|nr:TetR family transcriptional regulator [Caulobacteraceae bacterium]
MPARRSAHSLSRAQLHALVWSQPMAAAGKALGITGGGLAKVCDRLLIPYPGRGYWTRARVAEPPPPPPLPGVDEAGVVVAGERARSRRPRTRMSPEARREQLLDLTAALIRTEGTHAATLKRLAREAGVSEAQAHNLFPRRLDLLLALARREVDAMNAARLAQIELGRSNRDRVALSTIAYLRQAAERGALVQRLVDMPEVRAALRAERSERTRTGRRRMTERLSRDYGVPPQTAYGATAVLTAVCLRAGRLVAEGKIPLAMAERLSLAIVEAGNRAVIGPRPSQVRPN